ncbi:MAG: leucine-rich repeat protein, partial [Eubacteriales bacterium]
GTNQLTRITIPDSVESIDESAFASNDDLTEVKIGPDVTVASNAFSGDNTYFYDAYTVGGAGTYSKNQDGTWAKSSNVVLSLPAIAGVIAPVTGQTPVKTITETTEYTGTIEWNGNPSTFGADTVYTATIIITPKEGYTLTGVAENFFTVEGAIATNTADAAEVTAVFPKTEAETVTISDFKNIAQTGVSATFTWTAATEATSVKIQQSLNGANDWAEAETEALTESSVTATVTGLMYSTAYDFRLIIEGGENAGKSNVLTNIITGECPYTYLELSDNNVRITAYVGSDTVVEIPSTINGKTITYIGLGSGVFSDGVTPSQITSLVIPDSVISIGEFAFIRCSDLTSVTLSNNLTEISKCTFFNCTSLESITIPESVTAFGTSAFVGCSSLKSITIGSKVTEFKSPSIVDTDSTTSLKNAYNSGGAGTYTRTGSVWEKTGLATSVVVLGDNTEGQTDVPNTLKEVKAIAGGNGHIVALQEDGTVVAWGDNSFGQTDVPEDLTGVIAIAAGGFHTVALKEDGTIVAWGNNENGQVNVPSVLTNVKAIAAGKFHTVVLKEDGTVLAWGDNENGQVNVPDGLTDVKSIAAGEYHTVALKEDGTVVTWGDNDYGYITVPDGLTDVKAIAAGALNTIALKEDGTVVAWGKNSYKQTDVPDGLTNVKAIAAGVNHTVALKEDGTVVAWGFEDTQTEVSGLANVKSIAVGGYHTIAIVQNQ